MTQLSKRKSKLQFFDRNHKPMSLKNYHVHLRSVPWHILEITAAMGLPSLAEGIEIAPKQAYEELQRRKILFAKKFD